MMSSVSLQKLCKKPKFSHISVLSACSPPEPPCAKRFAFCARRLARVRKLCYTELRQHRAIASSHFGGSFLPILRFEKLEILRSRWRRRRLTDAACPLRVHTVFLHFSNLALTKNLSPKLLAELCAVALSLQKRRWNDANLQKNAGAFAGGGFVRGCADALGAGGGDLFCRRR